MYEDGTRIAYLVGINQYQDARIPPNRCAERDVNWLGYALERVGFEVFLYTGDFTPPPSPATCRRCGPTSATRTRAASCPSLPVTPW